MGVWVLVGVSVGGCSVCVCVCVVVWCGVVSVCVCVVCECGGVVCVGVTVHLLCRVLTTSTNNTTIISVKY